MPLRLVLWPAGLTLGALSLAIARDEPASSAGTSLGAAVALLGGSDFEEAFEKATGNRKRSSPKLLCPEVREPMPQWVIGGRGPLLRPIPVKERGDAGSLTFMMPLSLQSRSLSVERSTGPIEPSRSADGERWPHRTRLL